MAITLNDNAIITAADAQTFLKNSSAGAEADIQLAVNVLSSKFDELVGFQLVAQDYEEHVVDGMGTDELHFGVRNVTACTKVQYRSGIDSWSDLSSNVWLLDSKHKLGVVGYAGFTFAEGRMNYRADFTAGWAVDAMPGTIVDAFMHELKRWVERSAHVSTETAGKNKDVTTTYLSLTKATQRALQQYAIITM